MLKWHLGNVKNISLTSSGGRRETKGGALWHVRSNLRGLPDWLIFQSKARPLEWEHHRRNTGARLGASSEPTMCSLTLLSTSRWEACTDPDFLMLFFIYLALQHCFHLADCMLAAGQGPGLTNRTQISASHLPQGSSLELILASAAPQWWASVWDVTTCIYRGCLILP